MSSLDCGAAGTRIEDTYRSLALVTVTVRVVELATGGMELKAAARRALEQSRREECEGKVRRFRTAKDAVAHLKRV